MSLFFTVTTLHIWQATQQCTACEHPAVVVNQTGNKGKLSEQDLKQLLPPSKSYFSEYFQKVRNKQYLFSYRKIMFHFHPASR
jgi:hypothetical protein